MAKKPPTPEITFTPPANLEAEQSVLGAILVRPEVLNEVADILSPTDFYREAHGRIFAAMLALYAKGEPVDLVTVNALLKEQGQLEAVGGPVFLAGLSEQVGFATNALYYARIITDKARVRRLLDATQEISGACLAPVENISEFMDQAEQRFFEASRVNEGGGQIHPIGKLAVKVVERLEAAYGHENDLHGLLTGLFDYDRLTAGLHPGELTILAARPSMGKTALGLNIVWHVSHVLNEPVVFFSLEMPEEQLVQRLMSAGGRIDGQRVRRGLLDSQDWAKLQSIAGDMQDAPIFIDDSPGLRVMEMRARCRRMKSRHGLSLIVVDYLQLMGEPQGSRSRDEAVGKNAQAIKELAKELSVPALICCQVNREAEKRSGKRYQLSDLRESGAIEQAADNVLFMWREKEDVIAELELAKQRNGPVGKFKLTYSPAFTRFDNFAGESWAK